MKRIIYRRRDGLWFWNPVEDLRESEALAIAHTLSNHSDIDIVRIVEIVSDFEKLDSVESLNK